jgi:hypothetical protein
MSDQYVLIEAVTSAFRERGARGEIRPHAAWHDLDDGDRVVAFTAARVQRVVEAALDPEGLSTTAKAVLARVRGS